MKELKSLSNVLIRSERSLLKPSTNKAAIWAGHYPLVLSGQDLQTGSISPGIGKFGIYTIQTFELGCQLAVSAKESGREAKLVMMVDDHALIPLRHWYLPEEKRQRDDLILLKRKVQSAPRRLCGDGEESYLYNGVKDTAENVRAIRLKIAEYYAPFALPDELANVLVRYSLSEKDFTISKLSGQIVFAEHQYRQQFAIRYPTTDVGCAGEMGLIYEDLAAQGFDLFIGFSPKRCQGPVCHASTLHNLGAGQRMEKLLFFFSTDESTQTPQALESAGIWMHLE